MEKARATSRQETASLFAQIKQQAPNFFAVYDNDTGELLGHLADLSVSGMKMVCTEVLAPNATIHVRIDLPREVNNKAEIVAIAKTIWCKNHPQGGLYDVGFHFEDVSRVDRTVIQQLLSILSILVLNSAHTR